MLNFEETLVIAFISAVVAFATSLLFRWLDRERPVWRIVSDGFASASGDDGPFWLTVDVTNVGNGAAYDVALMNAHRAHNDPREKPVLEPGESLRGLVQVPIRRATVEFDEMGSYGGAYLAGPELRGLSLHVRYRRPPVFWWRCNRQFRLASLASRARKQRNDQRERMQLLR